MKRIITGVCILLVAGLIGSVIGFGTDAPLLVNPYYRSARAVTAEIENLEVINFDQSEKGYLIMVVLISDKTPEGSNIIIDEAFAKLANEDTELMALMVIYSYIEPLTMFDATSNYWLVAVYTKEVNDVTWQLGYPYTVGVGFPITDEQLEANREW